MISFVKLKKGVTMTKYWIWICHKCEKQVQEKLMGKHCPHCEEWLYNYKSKKEVRLVNLSRKEKDQ